MKMKQMKNWVFIENSNFGVISGLWFLVLCETDGNACGVNNSWYKFDI